MTTLPGVEPASCPRECQRGHIMLDDGSVYPCPRCRPDAFAAWSGGHYAPDHDRTKCADCQARSAGAPRTHSTAPRRLLP